MAVTVKMWVDAPFIAETILVIAIGVVSVDLTLAISLMRVVERDDVIIMLYTLGTIQDKKVFVCPDSTSKPIFSMS